jgi:hypothetical protein
VGGTQASRRLSQAIRFQLDSTELNEGATLNKILSQ